MTELVRSAIAQVAEAADSSSKYVGQNPDHGQANRLKHQQGRQR
ncbi:hypothetical protein [Microcoleus sp. FACHB-1515]|nr:hypothetical protein [Microcoleus sp. FACHB-1515]